MSKVRFYSKEIIFGIVWGAIITLLIVAPGVVSDAVDFVYANF